MLLFQEINLFIAAITLIVLCMAALLVSKFFTSTDSATDAVHDSHLQHIDHFREGRYANQFVFFIYEYRRLVAKRNCAQICTFILF